MDFNLYFIIHFFFYRNTHKLLSATGETLILNDTGVPLMYWLTDSVVEHNLNPSQTLPVIKPE
jgi:hypothetical protein